MFNDIFALLEKYFNRESAYAYVEKIYSTDRFFDSARFNLTAEFVYNEMINSGLSQVEKIPLIADGKTRYGDWVPPKAWDVKEAVLSLLNTDGSVETELHRYSETPCMLAMMSAGTKDGGIDAELVDIDACGEDYDLSGKIILTNKKPAESVKIAIEKKAAGIVSDYFPVYNGVRDTPDAMGSNCRWDNDFIWPVNDTGLFAFCVSPESGKILRNRIAEKKTALVRAEVDARFYDGVNYTVTGVIPGETREEFLLCAHLYEPGANDNASGCGMLLELARAVNKLIDDGKIKRPRRSVRFVFGYEVLGLTGYWVNNKENVKNTLCAINPDMVGAASAEKAPFTLWKPPPCGRSFIELLMPEIIDEYGKYKNTKIDFSVHGFGVGDNILSDPQAGVPTVCMIMHPALSYHSSMDDMSMVDMDIIKRNGILCGAAALFCAEPDEKGKKYLDELMESEEKEIKKEKDEKEKDIKEKDEKNNRIINFIKEYGMNKIKLSVQRYAEIGFEQTDEIEIDFYAGDYLDLVYEEIPARLTDGTLTLAGTYPPGEPPEINPFYNYAANCPLFWCDGKRTLSEIAVIAGTELGKNDLNKYQEELKKYFDVLIKLKHIKFK